MADMEPENAPDELMRTLGLRRRVTVDAEAGRAVLEFEAGPHMCHSGNIVQGGFVTGWIDATMAHAAIAKTGTRLDGPMLPLSLDITIAFHAAARPGLVQAEAWITRMGRSTCFAEGELKDLDGTVIAKGMSTIRLVPRPS